MRPMTFLKNVSKYENQMCNYHIIPFLYGYSPRFVNNIIMIIISTADLKYIDSFYILAVIATKAIVVQNSNCL